MVPIRMSRSGFGIVIRPSWRCRPGGRFRRFRSRAKTMARLLMLSVPRVSGSVPLSMARDEILDHAEMAADAVASSSGGTTSGSARSSRPSRTGLAPSARKFVVSIPDEAAALADDPPAAVPAGPQAVGAPAAAVGEHLAAGRTRRWRSPTSPARTRSWAAPIPGNRRSPARRSPCSAPRRTYGSPCRAAGHGASPRESRRNAGRRRSRHGCW